MRNTLATELIFDLSSPGRRASAIPTPDVPDRPLETLIPTRFQGSRRPALPEVTEGEVIRHFVNLSTRNMSVDTHFYPLGSCTMKYNPKRHERLSSLEGIVDIHPNQSVDSIQGMLAILFEMQQMLGEISGLPGVSLQPAAGAQGEFAALLVAGAYFRDRGEQRKTVIFPNSAHGTNPASAALAGFQTVQIASTPAGYVDLDDLARHLNDKTAVFMVTNPNTLGLFEQDITRIADLVHRAGALVYIDGANMNAICGITRPGDFGGDMQHYNVHKTFTGPHGAGGPGSGPIAVRDFLADYLPGPVVTRRPRAGGGYDYALTTPPKSIGRVRSFFGNVGILLRGYCYLRTLGAQGVRDMSRHAVLNANYLLARLKDVLPVPQGDRCLHEFVASAKIAKERGFTAMDIAKRLLDYGFHAPTVYFPLNVPEALMIEPTETESMQTLDAFADVLRKILTEDPEVLKGAPHSTEINRPDDVRAARQPVLRCLLKDG